MPIKTYRDLEIYQISYRLAMDIFEMTRAFPSDEKYSLTSQIVRSSRSIAANIAEGWSKRRYEDVFKRHLNDTLGSNTETQVWLDFVNDCGYISQQQYRKLYDKYENLGGKIHKLMNNWQTF
ncbi:MAG: four helix bundle protein [Planctomycetota bacterium]